MVKWKNLMKEKTVWKVFFFMKKKFFHVCTYSRSIVHLCNPSSIISRPTTKKWGKILINILGKHNSNEIMPKEVFMDKKFYSFFRFSKNCFYEICKSKTVQVSIDQHTSKIMWAYSRKNCFLGLSLSIIVNWPKIP